MAVIRRQNNVDHVFQPHRLHPLQQIFEQFIEFFKFLIQSAIIETVQMQGVVGLFHIPAGNLLNYPN